MGRLRGAVASGLMALLLPAAGLAQGVLGGQSVELRAMVIPEEGDPPSISSHVIRMVGGPGVELPSMKAWRAEAGDDPGGIVEVTIDIGADDLLLDFTNSDYTIYTDGFFVGYEFSFPGLAQEVIEQARLHPQERLGRMQDKHLIPVPGGLRLHVGDMEVDPWARVRILFPSRFGPSS